MMALRRDPSRPTQTASKAGGHSGLFIIMLAKTNAVLDGVTTFLKYGTLDSSNSDVRLGELDHPSSV